MEGLACCIFFFPQPSPVPSWLFPAEWCAAGLTLFRNSVIHPISGDSISLNPLGVVIAKCMMNAYSTEKMGEISAWSKGIADGRAEKPPS